MPLKSIGENLIIKNGVIVCIDGTPLAEYLQKFVKEGDKVNVVKHEVLVELNNEASMPYTMCA
jgi:hypothetical protein